MPKRDNTGCLAIAFLVTVASIASGILFAEPTPTIASEYDACYMAQKFVKEQLKAPSTAHFAPCRAPDTTVKQIGGAWQVRSYVDAENSFSAQLRNNFSAKLVYYPTTDTWTLVGLNMSGP